MKSAPSLTAIKTEQCRRSLYRFVRETWEYVEPTPFVDGWHIRLICRALELAYKGKLPDNSLGINVPPSHMKSLLCATFFPAWVWTKKPGARFLCISFSADAENKSSRKCRYLVESDWYHGHFGVTLAADNNSMSEYATTAGGIRWSVGINGTITSRHADFIIMDDLVSAADAESTVEIEKANSRYDDVITSRMSDPNTTQKILLCQRLAVNDIVGHINSRREPYEWIILPAEYEGVRYTSHFPELLDPRVTNGELLWPERFGEKAIAKIKLIMSILGYSGQYQQRPTPAGGHTFQRDWFLGRVMNTEVAGRIISVDTSYGNNSKSDYSSIGVGEFTFDYHLFLRDVQSERMEFPQLIEAIESTALRYSYKLKKIVIEGKANGLSVIQHLNQSSKVIHELEYDLGILQNTLIVAWPLKGAQMLDKKDRAAIASHWCEKGCTLLPPADATFPWLSDFEDELFQFPQAAYDDSVDMFSQMIEFCAPKLSEGLQARS